MSRPRLVLLDIEGTVSPLAYVHEVMFPFARAGVRPFLEANVARPEVVAALDQMAVDAGAASFAAWCPSAAEPVPWIVAQVHALMDADVKATGLKQLQGLIWEGGFHRGALRSVLFADVAGALRRWHADGVELRIYSSGSVQAQRLFFAHTEAGDLTPLLNGFYDTKIGGKKSSASYAAIAADAGRAPEAILFLSDVVEELDAARAAGLATALALRPGNRAQPPHTHPTFTSLEQITP
jgi:enolase-phosphatase E1